MGSFNIGAAFYGCPLGMSKEIQACSSLRPLFRINAQPTENRMPSLLLASSSSYRRELLTRLRLPFACKSPDIDESHRPGETAHDLVRRLAREKAEALADEYPRHLIIGSDQVAVLDGQVLGKPHTFERALGQLTAASGTSVTFLTGLALLNSTTGECQVDCVPFTVHMRELDRASIERYLHAEEPYDCAGSFKAEGLGVSLFRSTDGSDATSLIGLPLIRLVDMLIKEGVSVP
ncbi:Maf-like protein [Pseudomonas syringae pv. tagetis]|uniref:7-methyl-GTP pyrophosphatase n=2 Tax=Pseudomonas syringae pv. tagetis TaxID=129140 RepID=A0A0Q0GTE7_9PSED|nr:Maf-like protein [Pseudomonas syringae pv. tagetis]